jgi:regulator of protease activity HflC (stomatin/prohibitin superfamily)
MVAFPWSLDVEPPPTTGERKRWRFFERHLPNLSIGLMALMLVAAVLYPYMVITVPSGHVGVLWKRFNGFGIYCWCWVGRGTVLNPEELRDEGLHLIWPWNRLFIYDLRLQSATETYNAISKEGVSLSATINIRFQLKRNSVALLHKFIGPGYEVSVVRPEIGSRTREVMAQYTAEQVYSTARQQIEEEIRKGAERRLSDNLDRLVQPESSEQAEMKSKETTTKEEMIKEYEKRLKNSILLIDTLVLGIELPAPIVGAINRKIEQYYLVQEYTYRVEREMKESERKQIEANGIHAFQQTVSQGISDSYLRWRGIEATLALAQSTNSKIVIVGGGKDGLPIILGNVDAPPPSPAAAPPAGTSPAGTPPAGTPPAGTPPAGTPPTGTPPTGTPPAGTPPAGAAPTGTPPPATEGAATPKDKLPATGSKPPAAKPDASTTLKWSDIEAIISRLTQALRPTGSEAPPPAKSPSEKPAAEAPR